MAHPESEVFLPIVILLIVFTAGTIIPICITWLQNCTKMRAIEVLKIYAEKGQEPPASVLETINRINWPFPPGAPPPKPMREQGRGEHLTHVAGSVCLAGGSAIVLWWQASELHGGRPGWLMITAIFTTIFFTGAAAARLVAALTAGDGRR